MRGMIDQRRIEDTFRDLDRYLSILRASSKVAEAELTNDALKLGAVKYLILSVSFQRST